MSIQERVIKVLSYETNWDISDILVEGRLLDDYGFDSFDMVTLSISIEEEFDIMILDNEFYECTTVQDLINTITEILERP